MCPRVSRFAKWIQISEGKTRRVFGGAILCFVRTMAMVYSAITPLLMSEYKHSTELNKRTRVARTMCGERNAARLVTADFRR